MYKAALQPQTYISGFMLIIVALTLCSMTVNSWIYVFGFQEWKRSSVEIECQHFICRTSFASLNNERLATAVLFRSYFMSVDNVCTKNKLSWLSRSSYVKGLAHWVYAYGRFIFHPCLSASAPCTQISPGCCFELIDTWPFEELLPPPRRLLF